MLCLAVLSTEGRKRKHMRCCTKYKHHQQVTKVPGTVRNILNKNTEVGKYKKQQRCRVWCPVRPDLPLPH
ncbi:hypothetical protein AOXY_G14913 [Acipenser oxyrinchus oxyrinchus]|uniref:Uncharacterized protein n=1 Tax=Acipenser oxyrinchus oxyrinchus TaxID=40147 RepID=A0AAD8G4B9_ACIOX|nr:hypothetical protein AOXY_G14913 [Acipenser oxyrinchus oxyrinchus]